MFFMLLFSAALAFGQSVGEVVQAEGLKVLRAGETHGLAIGDELFAGDRLEATSAQVLLYPSNQVNLAGALSLEDVSETQTNVKLERGHVHINVDSEKAPQQFRVRTPMATFGVRGTEFEVEETGDGVELQVLEGSVEADDLEGNVQQVKPREAFKKLRGQKGWQRREFRQRVRRFAFLRREEARARRELRRSRGKERGPRRRR